jgi:hypothetical protein
LLHGKDTAAGAGIEGGAAAEIGFLQKEAAVLQQQLRAIQKRLHELHGKQGKPASKDEE